MKRTRLWVCGAASVVLGATCPALGGGLPGLFDTPWVGFDAGDYSSARYFYGLVAADFDNDGDPDVATCSWPNIPAVTVLRNRGDGTYAAPDVYPLPEGSYDILCGDFDGDGYVDLVAANTEVNYFGTSVSCLRNNRDGTFAPALIVPTGAEAPTGLAAADFDRDSDLDLVVANWGRLGNGSTVSLLRNDGNGSFAPAETFPAGAAPFQLTAADLNNDGWPDLAVANGTFNSSQAARINLLFNDGAGAFLAPQQLPAFWPSMLFFPAITAADVDRDNDVDLLYSHTGLSTGGGYMVALLRNTGNGVFAPPEPLPLGTFTGGATSLAVRDVTGDGWPDILGTHGDSDGWSLLEGTGGGSFGPARRAPSGYTPVEVTTADVDGDSDFDALIINRDSLEVCVHINPGDGDFFPAPTFTTDPFSLFCTHGDIDNDKDLDAVTAGGDLRIFRNLGDGVFAPQEIYNPGVDPLDVKLRDLDGDGFLDLLFNEGSPPYRWGSALNDGQGHFLPASIWPVPTCGYFLFAEIDAFDLDNDKDLDVVQIEILGCPSIPTSSRRVFINENLGNGTFQLVDVLVVNPSPRSVAAADFNHDGNLDLAVTGQPTTILLGHGDLTFTMVDAANLPGINITTADFNDDGHEDIALAIARLYEFVESMAVQLGNGDGTFQPPQIYPGSHAPSLGNTQREILAGDPDEDGDWDVMIANSASHDLSFWANNGDGTFQRQVRYGLGVSPRDFEYADFTGDGIPDVLTLLSSFPPLSYGLGLVPGLGDGPIPGDFDGDGDVDLSDFTVFQLCFGGANSPPAGTCPPGVDADLDADGDVDLADFLIFQQNFTGSQ